MQDTTILLDPSFVVENVYAEKDALDANGGVRLTKRELMIRAMRDSLNAIGNALMRAAEMQDTTIELEPAFIVREIYAQKDSLKAIRDSARTLQMQAAQMQDTTIELDPSFIVLEVYANKDILNAKQDSARALAEQAPAGYNIELDILIIIFWQKILWRPSGNCNGQYIRGRSSYLRDFMRDLLLLGFIVFRIRREQICMLILLHVTQATEKMKVQPESPFPTH